MNRIGDGQPRVAIDARTGIPAAVLAFVANADGKQVLLPRRFEAGRQVKFKTRVTVRMIAERLAIDPKTGVHVNAVESHDHALATVPR